MPEFESEAVRRSTIAGTWYPGTEKSLARTVDDHISRAVSAPVTGQLLALISPHAGYAYSGQTAAYAYRQLESRKAERPSRSLPTFFGPSKAPHCGGTRMSKTRPDGLRKVIFWNFDFGVWI